MRVSHKLHIAYEGPPILPDHSLMTRACYCENAPPPLLDLRHHGARRFLARLWAATSFIVRESGNYCAPEKGDVPVIHSIRRQLLPSCLSEPLPTRRTRINKDGSHHLSFGLKAQ